MHRLLFYIIYSPLYLLSLLPLKALYWLTTLLKKILFSLFGYRKEVILINLAGAFPTLFYPNILNIYREFITNFSQIVAENIKLISLSPVKIKEMVTIANPEVLEHYFKNGKAVIITGGHIGNWEFLTKMHHFNGGDKLGYNSSHFSFIYQEQRSKLSDKIVKRIRSSNSEVKLIPSQAAARTILKQSDVMQCYFLFADQCPLEGSKFKFNFLNRPTTFFGGPEVLSSRTGMATLFLRMERKEKGKYIVKFEEITDTPTTCEKGYITERYAQLLEEAIVSQPSNWLWSHKRWKRL